MTRVASRIWAVWVGGASSPPAEATGDFLTLAYSDDGGTNWSREFYLVPQFPATDRVGDAQLWLAPDNKLWVVYFQSGNNQVIDGQLGVWVSVVSNPLGMEPIFEPGEFLADGLAYQPFKVGAEWYLPIDYVRVRPRFPERVGRKIYKIDWRNRRVTFSGRVPNGPNSDFEEPNYVELRDGRIYTISRSLGGMLETRSRAGTFEFDTPVPFRAFASAESRSSLGRSPSGRLFIIFNKAVSATNLRDRTNMTIAFSEDEGVTWPYSYTFDTRMNLSYPAFDFAQNGDILVIYDHDRTNRREIVLATIDEPSVVAGTPRVRLNVVNRPMP